jgi:bacterioferritin (cytochrome b1)
MKLKMRVISRIGSLVLLAVIFVFFINLTSRMVEELGRERQLQRKYHEQNIALNEKQTNVLEMRRVRYIEGMPDFTDAVLKSTGKKLDDGETGIGMR